MDKRIQQAYDFIKKNHRQKLLLQDLATTVALSPFHFQRLFQQEMGESPARCIHRIRLERAGHLIRANPDLTISEVAMDCGFSSLSTFSRAFSKKYGMPPGTFCRSSHPGDINTNIFSQEAPSNVKIEYFPKTSIYYAHTSVFREDLLDHFQAALSFCELEGIHHPSKKMIGVWTHITLHHPQDEFNYYAGAQLADNVDISRLEKVFTIPEGKYACFTSNGSYRNLWDTVMPFKTGWLDKKPYVMSDLFAFEIIASDSKKSDYPCLQRRICVPIRHK